MQLWLIIMHLSLASIAFSTWYLRGPLEISTPPPAVPATGSVPEFPRKPPWLSEM